MGGLKSLQTETPLNPALGLCGYLYDLFLLNHFLARYMHKLESFLRCPWNSFSVVLKQAKCIH